MAGHSKWANIKHKKAREDAKRGKVFTKLIKEITVCAKAGGGEPENNPRLRQLLDKAKTENMPQDNIIRAIKKGTGELPGVVYEPITYEGYGPGGTAIIVETLTDNKNRTVADLRHLFSKHGGNLAEAGSVNWMFEKLGVVRGSAQNKTEDDLFETFIEHDVKDISIHDDIFTVTCDIPALQEVKETAEQTGLAVEDAELEWVAKNSMDVDDDIQEKAFNLLEKLEEHDDVQNVFTNIS